MLVHTYKVKVAYKCLMRPYLPIGTKRDNENNDDKYIKFDKNMWIRRVVKIW